MNNFITPALEEETPERRHTVPDLKVIEGGLIKTGGNGPTNPDNWLSGLDVGTIFLCRKIKGVPLDNPIVEQYEVLDRIPDGTCYKLHSNLNKEDITMWVLSQTFSHAARYITTIGKVQQ